MYSMVCGSYGISFHRYADDTQLYVPVKVDDGYQISKLETSLTTLKSWLTEDFLRC